MFLVVLGDCAHEQVSNLANSHFSKISKLPSNGIPPDATNEERPIYTPSNIQIRDDDVEHAHVGIFFQVPGFNSKVFPHLLIMQRLFGK